MSIIILNLACIGCSHYANRLIILLILDNLDSRCALLGNKTLAYELFVLQYNNNYGSQQPIL
jgi:hypothetical protein